MEQRLLAVSPLSLDRMQYSVPPTTWLHTDPDGTEWLEWSQPRDWSLLSYGRESEWGRAKLQEWLENEPHEFPQSPPGGTCLAAFIRLADASAEELYHFARRWGPLGDNAHRALTHKFRARRDPWEPWPSDYHRLYDDSVKRSGDELLQLMYSEPERFFELADVWRLRATQLASILSIAANLQADLPGSMVDWRSVLEADDEALTDSIEHWEAEIVYAAFPEAARSVQDEQHGSMSDDEVWRLRILKLLEIVDVSAQQELLASIVDLWLKYYGLVQMYCEWDREAGRVSLSLLFDENAGLASLLAAELGAVLSSPLGLYQCSSCGYTYTPEKRRPRGDRKRYCQTCSGGASLAAKRDWYHRNKTRRPQSDPALQER